MLSINIIQFYQKCFVKHIEFNLTWTPTINHIWQTLILIAKYKVVKLQKPQGRDGKRHLQADVGLRREEIRGQLQVRLAAHEVDRDERLAAIALVAVQTLAAGVRADHHALCPVQALVVVARAGAREHHGRRELAEQPTGTHRSELWGIMHSSYTLDRQIDRYL